MGERCQIIFSAGTGDRAQRSHLGDGAAGAEEGDVEVVEAALLDDLKLVGLAHELDGLALLIRVGEERKLCTRTEPTVIAKGVRSATGRVSASSDRTRATAPSAAHLVERHATRLDHLEHLDPDRTCAHTRAHTRARQATRRSRGWRSPEEL